MIKILNLKSKKSKIIFSVISATLITASLFKIQEFRQNQEKLMASAAAVNTIALAQSAVAMKIYHSFVIDESYEQKISSLDSDSIFKRFIETRILAQKPTIVGPHKKIQFNDEQSVVFYEAGAGFCKIINQKLNVDDSVLKNTSMNDDLEFLSSMKHKSACLTSLEDGKIKHYHAALISAFSTNPKSMGMYDQFN